MAAPISPGLSPRDVLQMLKDHRRLWLVPMIVCGVLGGAFGLLRERSWRASQALIIREEASTRDERLGSFGDVSEMKTAQETIHELLRSKSVLRAALVEVGPPADYAEPAAWPDDEDIADLRESLKLTPPGGAEFGKTEVFYLQVKQKNRQRAIHLASALCSHLQSSFQALRHTKYESVISELSRSEALAEANLQKATEELAVIEREAGVDLAELRMLHTSSSATSDLRQKLVEVENEIRSARAEELRNRELLALLRGAQENPGRLLASPNSLLDAQPALRRLKEGLVDAQLRTAELEGSMAAAHPLVKAAKTAQQEIGQHLHHELAIAIEGVELDLRINADRIASLQKRLAADRGRLEKLAAMRANYSNRIAMSQNRTELLEQARANLASARAHQAAAGNVSLISRIDAPDTGTKPVGPGALTLALAGCCGGLAFGLGLVFLTVEPSELRLSQTVADPLREELASPAGISLGPSRRKLDRQPAWS